MLSGDSSIASAKRSTNAAIAPNQKSAVLPEPSSRNTKSVGIFVEWSPHAESDAGLIVAAGSVATGTEVLVGCVALSGLDNGADAEAGLAPPLLQYLLRRTLSCSASCSIESTYLMKPASFTTAASCSGQTEPPIATTMRGIAAMASSASIMASSAASASPSMAQDLSTNTIVAWSEPLNPARGRTRRLWIVSIVDDMNVESRVPSVPPTMARRAPADVAWRWKSKLMASSKAKPIETDAILWGMPTETTARSH